MTMVATAMDVLVLTERARPTAFVEDLARNGRYRLLGRLDSVRAALHDARVNQADVVVAEVSSFERLWELAAALPQTSTTRVVVVSDLPAEAALLVAMAAGARAFLRKPVDAEDVEAAVDAVVRGEAFVDPRSTSWLVELAMHGHLVRPADGLTLRQWQAVELVRGGLTNREIARVMGVSPATVKSHLHEALRRLGVADRWAATVLAERLREGRP